MVKKESNNSNKRQVCGRPINKESKYLIFHTKLEEKEEEEFEKA